MNVYVSNPSARVVLTVQVGFQGPAPPRGPLSSTESAIENWQWLASIYISVVPFMPSESIRWIVEIHGATTNANRLPTTQPSPPPSRPIVDVFEGVTHPADRARQDQSGTFVGYFVARPLGISRGNLVVQTPDIAPNSYTFSDISLPSFGIEEPAPPVPVAGAPPPAPPPVPGPPPSLPPLPHPGSSSVPTKIALSPGSLLTDQTQVFPNYDGQFTRLRQADILTKYYVPQALITKDQLNAPLAQYEPITDYPSNASFSTSSVAWQGVGELSPTLTAIGIGVSDTRANYTFIAGVALAIAAGALIALLQEVNAQRRRRKDTADEPVPPPPAAPNQIT